MKIKEDERWSGENGMKGGKRMDGDGKKEYVVVRIDKICGRKILNRKKNCGGKVNREKS